MERDYLLSNAAYDFLQKVVQLFLPGVGTLYFTLGEIWGFPNGEQVVGTCAAVAVFLGVILRFSNRSYENSDARYDGSVEIRQLEGKKLFQLNINKEPENLQNDDEFLLQVKELDEH